MRLAGLIDYSLRPGVAALAWLAFTVDDGKTLRVPRRLRVQSVPGQDEQPQIFETLEEITGRRHGSTGCGCCPAPYGVNPLAPGATPGARSLPARRRWRRRAASRPASAVVLYRTGAAGRSEELTVAAVDAVEDRVTLCWQGRGPGQLGATDAC